MDRNLFHMIMEADGDLVEPFDAGAEEVPANDATNTPVANDSPPIQDDMTPPLADDGGGMGFDPSGEDENSDESNINDETDDSNSGNENSENQKLSEKANGILNQTLYQKMVSRNQEIEDIIENIQTIIPVLTYDIVKENDITMNRLKAALAKGQDYVLNTFVDSKYGENYLYYKKLDALYTLLLDEINKNLKKVQLNS